MTETVALYMCLSSEDANEGESFSIGNQRDLLYHFLKDHREFDGCTVMEFCDDADIIGLNQKTFDLRGFTD